MHCISSWVEVLTMTVVFQTSLDCKASTGTIYVSEGLCPYWHCPLFLNFTWLARVPMEARLMAEGAGSVPGPSIQLKLAGDFWHPGVIWVSSGSYADSYSLRDILPSFNQKVRRKRQWDLPHLQGDIHGPPLPSRNLSPPAHFFWLVLFTLPLKC